MKFSQFVNVTGVVTQGSDDSDDWVTSYMLSYSQDGLEFHSYHGREKHMVRCSMYLLTEQEGWNGEFGLIEFNQCMTFYYSVLY